MDEAEQKAFVKAYKRHVNKFDEKHVAEFVRKYSNGELLNYSSDYIAIIDSLSMWHEAVRFTLEKR